MNYGIPTTGIITAGSMRITLISIKQQKQNMQREQMKPFAPVFL